MMFSTMRDDVVLGKFGTLAGSKGAKAQAEGHLVTGLLHRLSVWRARRVVAAELYNMSDRELNDIGLSYGDIPRVVRTVR